MTEPQQSPPTSPQPPSEGDPAAPVTPSTGAAADQPSATDPAQGGAPQSPAERPPYPAGPDGDPLDGEQSENAGGEDEPAWNPETHGQAPEDRDTGDF